MWVRELPALPRVHRVPASPLSRTRVSEGVPAHHQTVEDPRMHIFSDRRYIYTYGYETARERTRIRPETVASGAGEGGEKQTTGAEECETEYEPVEAGLRDEGGLPTFSVRQQELGGKANLDGPSIPTARDDHSRTGLNRMGICTTTTDETVAAACSSVASDTPH